MFGRQGEGRLRSMTKISRRSGMRFAYIQSPLAFVLGVSAFAWAFGFSRYFDHWIYFPAFPNALDSLGMSIVGFYLLYAALSKRHPSPSTPGAELKPILSVFDDIDPADES